MGKKRRSQPTHIRSRLLDLLVQTYKRTPGLSSNLRQSASTWSWDMLRSATTSFLTRDWRSYAQRWKEFCDQNAITWSCDRKDILEIGYGDSRFKADIITSHFCRTPRSHSVVAVQTRKLLSTKLRRMLWKESLMHGFSLSA